MKSPYFQFALRLTAIVLILIAFEIGYSFFIIYMVGDHAIGPLGMVIPILIRGMIAGYGILMAGCALSFAAHFSYKKIKSYRRESRR